MALDSSVRGGVVEGEYHLIGDPEINDLRKAIWRTIFQERGDLSDADIAFALGVVQYELIHHVDEDKD
jgi:hypothetical protein